MFFAKFMKLLNIAQLMESTIKKKNQELHSLG